MQVQEFFHDDTATYTYVVIDESTNKCALIDTVLDYDMYSGKFSTESADKIIEYIRGNSLVVEWILETHIHADHISAADYLRNKLNCKVAIGANIKKVLDYWLPIFNTSKDTDINGSQFDRLFHDNDSFKIGQLEVQVIHTPGHTPACLSYLIEDKVFVGDTIFMPYMGTARTDFPGGSAELLYDSIQKLYSLPDNTEIHVGHDYPPSGEKPYFKSTVKEQKERNSMLKENTSKEQYVKARELKDKGKAVPKMLLPAIQTNCRAGKFGKPEENGVSYMKLPIQKNKYAI